jgi:large subunit ribosomal protein L22
MDIKARASYIHIAPRKVRLVVDLIRPLGIEAAVNQLTFLPSRSAKPVLKLLNSAIANATNNFNLVRSNLLIKEIRVDEGPDFTRWMPKAFGRATPISKKTSHISIILTEKVPSKKKLEKKEKFENTKIVNERAEIVNEKPAEKVDSTVKGGGEKEGAAKEIFDVRMKGKHRHKQNQDRAQAKGKGFIKKIFSRKSGE